MKWKRNAKDGVSPVIAVILMVAITVVLAGVVVLWVTRLSKTQEEAPEILNLEVHAYDGHSGNTEDTIVFTVLSGSVDWSLYKITVNGTIIWNGAAVTGWTGPTGTTTAGETATFTLQTGGSPDIAVGQSYNIKIINIGQQKVVWEKDVTAVAA